MILHNSFDSGNGVFWKDGIIAICYGAADTYTAVAYTLAEELVAYIKRNSERVDQDAVLLR